MREGRNGKRSRGKGIMREERDRRGQGGEGWGGMGR